MSSSNSPCAACKLQRRKCTQECIYAPYFPPDQPQKFANVHKVFGASNVAKLLSELNAAHREDAVNSLAYEAEARLRDPVYGCVGLISFLQQNLKQIQQDLFAAKKELAAYMGYMPQQHMAGPYDMSPMLGHPSGPSHGGQLLIRELQPQPQQYQNQQHHQKQQQHMLEAQEMGANEEQEVLRNLEQQPRQQELLRFNTGFDGAGTVAGSGFNQMTPAPSLTLGKFDNPY